MVWLARKKVAGSRAIVYFRKREFSERLLRLFRATWDNITGVLSVASQLSSLVRKGILQWPQHTTQFFGSSGKSQICKTTFSVQLWAEPCHEQIVAKVNRNMTLMVMNSRFSCQQSYYHEYSQHHPNYNEPNHPLNGSASQTHPNGWQVQHQHELNSPGYFASAFLFENFFLQHPVLNGIFNMIEALATYLFQTKIATPIIAKYDLTWNQRRTLLSSQIQKSIKNHCRRRQISAKQRKICSLQALQPSLQRLLQLVTVDAVQPLQRPWPWLFQSMQQPIQPRKWLRLARRQSRGHRFLSTIRQKR